ncbi:uncharacterized protein VICG_00512 [Vittaforma corneae ATCC 50505]|uniref:Uncharacterized protein n=1 Tax=Vittaforma corneae (strain ATCC 50505) TaxID=993615 RepID=L2GND7_VITCO|nr:uncharacterized protein VICG_00512 [Vittaforma corneae ATCC 50505]ELA42413.1 hypothetical protein VICG_00512 [Vittaforma corneae ATCC 50505]
MKSAVEKAVQISQKFLSNVYFELGKDPELSKSIIKLKHQLFDNPVVKSIYKGLQLSEYFIANSLKDYCSAPRPSTNVDKFFERAFNIPQYYGGVRDVIGPHALSNIFEPLNYLSNSRVYKDYKVLQKIENRIIPEILKRLFGFKELDNTTKETDESLKHLKEYIFNQERDWTDKEIILEDIRSVETESVNVKNLKKTVKCSFELSVILSGVHNDKRKNLRESFSCSFDFINENGRWIASNFSFSPFN